MIKNWLITGDTHGTFFRLADLDSYDAESTAIIILGDAGLNYFLNKKDIASKQEASSYGFTLYIIRGNHDERPQNIKDMKQVFDKNVNGIVYQEEEFPLINYLIDGNVYSNQTYNFLVIGGAYSVDKYYRLSQRWQWFEQEQLTEEERLSITEQHRGKEYDFILSHTCPYSWRPVDMFIGTINQSTVDNSMEYWLEGFKDIIKWKVWCFGHYHDDRLIRPGVEMLYKSIESLDVLLDRWTSNKEIEWWLKKDPNYYLN